MRSFLLAATALTAICSATAQAQTAPMPAPAAAPAAADPAAPLGKLPGLGELGVTAHPLGLYLDRWMVRYREHGRFGEKSAA